MFGSCDGDQPVSADDWNHRTDVNYPLMNASVQPDKYLPEDWYFDYQIATKGINLLTELNSQSQPWFLGVGFHQPHRPWHHPKKYWDLYKDVKLPLTPHTRFPEGAPPVATGDINPITIGLLPHSEKVYWASPEGGVGIDAIYENVRGYYASISFLDHQVGRILDAVEELKIADDTVIMFCVDHGEGP